mgnify:CR=1 FL=1
MIFDRYLDNVRAEEMARLRLEAHYRTPGLEPSRAPRAKAIGAKQGV